MNLIYPMRKIILVLVAFVAIVNVQAQELRATVKVLSPEYRRLIRMYLLPWKILSRAF